jgi:hypothetical protein
VPDIVERHGLQFSALRKSLDECLHPGLDRFSCRRNWRFDAAKTSRMARYNGALSAMTWLNRADAERGSV